MTLPNPNSQILAQHDGSYTASRYFYLHDRVGSVRQIIDTSGYVKNYYTYNPFGETIESGGSLANSFMFTGQFYDSEINEYYLRARQYDPHIARFTSRDPVFGKVEEPLTLHRYLYCLNEPINRIDPFGLYYTIPGKKGWFYNVSETQQVIDYAVELTSTFRGFRNAFTGARELDYKRSGLVFTLSGFYGRDIARDSEFGNYLAGYTCDYHWGLWGEIGVRTAGHVFALGDLALAPIYPEATQFSRSKLLAPLAGAFSLNDMLYGPLKADDYGSRYWITKGVLDAELTQKGGPLSTIRAFQLKIFQDYYYAMHFLEQMIDSM